MMTRALILSAGAVVVSRAAVEPRYLLLRAYRNWDFPKGLVERGEEALAAAVREVREETGLVELEFPWGDAFVETAPYGRGKVARYYLALASTERVALRPDPTTGIFEHHEFRWLPYPAARALLVPRLATVLEWAAARVTAALARP
jgi:8-oxo-dGTP pyrophosphatase MutT (NUDIX family)